MTVQQLKYILKVAEAVSYTHLDVYKRQVQIVPQKLKKKSESWMECNPQW